MRKRLRLLLTSVPCLLLIFALAPSLEAPLVARPSQPIKPMKVWWGAASWYGPTFQGRTTASGELYDLTASTAAHQTGDFAELVCSNSLKSETENTAPWLLKEELRRAGSLLIGIARDCAVPAGHALAVDRATFAARVTEAVSREPLISICREEVAQIDEDQITIVATGPLTSDALSREIGRLSGAAHLFFYDSISPIVESDSIDMAKVYLAARYDKGSADYINCPMSREEYDCFYNALLAAQSVEEREWEKLNYFESCLPIEEIARRGRDTLRFGPMKPVGLKDPRTGRIPYAAVQLRQENLRADSYNLVGFQNHLKFGEQHVYQCADAAVRDPADERTPARVVCGTDLRGRRLCGIDRRRTHGGNSRSHTGRGCRAGSASSGKRVWIADELHHTGRPQEISAG